MGPHCSRSVGSRREIWESSPICRAIQVTAFVVSALAIAGRETAQAQGVVNAVPGQAVYEYQLNYRLPWNYWYGGPGLSFGGTMPTKGVFGYSTLNGIPFPGPLGAGAYLTAPPPHGAAMPLPGHPDSIR